MAATATVADADNIAFLLLSENQRIGRVVSVAGSQSVVLMEESADNKAVIPAGLMMGTIVKMPLPETVVYGLVCGLSVPIPATEPGAPEMKIMVLTRDSTVAEMITGARTSTAKGLCRPPVR